MKIDYEEVMAMLGALVCRTEGSKVEIPIEEVMALQGKATTFTTNVEGNVVTIQVQELNTADLEGMDNLNDQAAREH